ncbi:right-handed parallel beta-helix repeat-containing protein [Paenibacillus wenxiniae]|uniref:Right-handed parallel beta-helix repeat-containing protein n=1 Tax=Paenibacillus wenxiniae TaxID=1636843 RepID=A0ABW4REM5_9BACL
MTGWTAWSLAALLTVGGVGTTHHAQAASTVSYTASSGFGSTQGGNGWHYQQKNGTTYSDLTYQSAANRWDAGGSYPWVSSNAQHPGNTADSVRTWIAPGSGTITIDGTVKKGSADGDGITATIMKDSTSLWTQTIQTTTEVQPADVTNIPVQQGTEIHFVVNRIGSISFDHTLWNPTIVFTPGAYVPDDHSLSILDFGAVANDNQPDDAAMAAAIQQAKTEGKDVYVPAGHFELSDILTVDGVTLKGENKAQSILTSTNPERGSIDLTGNSPAIRNLAHVYSSVAERDGKNQKNSISVKQATNFVVDHIDVQKASTAGIYVTDSIGGTITNNTVQYTQADGIHLTGDSSDITVQYNTVKQVGDDTIAVVSYGPSAKSSGDQGQTNNIRILNNDVGYDSNARGISVVGGRDVQIEGNHIERTQMAGIYIATETGDNNDYNTQPVDSITINNNTVDRTALKPGGGHADMLVYAGYTAINNVTFNDNTSSNATKYSAGVWGRSTPQIGTVTFNNTTIINPKDPNQVYNFLKGTVYWNGNQVYPTNN